MQLLLVLLFAFISISLSITCSREVSITNVERIGEGVLINPETIVEDSKGFLYTGIYDGSIRKINPATLEITTYAYSVILENRTGCGDITKEQHCGRVLGLGFDSNDNLYVADAYKGLLKIPRSDPTSILTLSTSSSSDGIPLKFTNSLAIDEEAGIIYFTDSSYASTRDNFLTVVLERKAEGRLLKYNMATGQTTTLLKDIRFANGVSLSKDKTFVLINELSTRRVIRYWTKGEHIGKNETFIHDIGGYNDNIELDHVTGNFIVGVFAGTSEIMSFIQDHQKVANIFNTYVPPPVTLGMVSPEGIIKVITPNGRIERTLRDQSGSSIAFIAEARRIKDYIYIGSVINPFLARIPSSLLTSAMVCE